MASPTQSPVHLLVIGLEPEAHVSEVSKELLVGLGTGTTSMMRFEFHLNISSQRYLDYYRGTAKQVVAKCKNGATVRFPASLLIQFVTNNGIHGDFVLTCDDSNKGAQLQRLTIGGTGPVHYDADVSLRSGQLPAATNVNWVLWNKGDDRPALIATCNALG